MTVIERIFGKKKEGMSFNFVPYYEPINKERGIYVFFKLSFNEIINRYLYCDFDLKKNIFAY